MVIRTVDLQLIQRLELMQSQGILDVAGQKLLGNLQASEEAQAHYLEAAQRDVKEFDVVTRHIEAKKAAEEANSFKTSESAVVLRSAAHVPGYITVNTLPQVNHALAQYSTLVKNNPTLVTDPTQAGNLPFTRLELFSIGRETKKIEVEDKGLEILALEEVTAEYEVELKKTHGDKFDCRVLRESELNQIKLPSGRDILNFKHETPEMLAKSPPQVQRQHTDVAKDTGAVRF